MRTGGGVFSFVFCLQMSLSLLVVDPLPRPSLYAGIGTLMGVPLGALFMSGGPCGRVDGPWPRWQR